MTERDRLVWQPAGARNFVALKNGGSKQWKDGRMGIPCRVELANSRWLTMKSHGGGAGGSPRIRQPYWLGLLNAGYFAALRGRGGFSAPCPAHGHMGGVLKYRPANSVKKSDRCNGHQASALSRSPHPRESLFLTSFRASTFSQSSQRSSFGTTSPA